MKRIVNMHLAVMVGVVLLGLASNAPAQTCQPQWFDKFGYADFNNTCLVFCEYDDDGAGPNPSHLYAGGLFTRAGATPVNYIARWNGAPGCRWPTGSTVSSARCWRLTTTGRVRRIRCCMSAPLR